MIMPKTPKTKKDEFNFEVALNDLSILIDQMEQGQLPLDKALENFERGIALVRQCQEALKNAEQKVQILMEKAGQPALAPYDTEDDS
jgi:exodeoxyribonuclease VII small subunit